MLVAYCSAFDCLIFCFCCQEEKNEKEKKMKNEAERDKGW